MTDELENDTLTNEGDQDTTPETESEMVKKEAYENQKIRAEKAERELKELKAETQTPKKEVETETPKKEEQSNDPDYAKLAFLEGKGIKHPDDQKIVQDEASRLKLPLTDILGMEHIKGKLKNAKDQREAEDGMPDGGGKPGGGSKGSVEHWVNKKNKDGSYALSGNLELDSKIIDARTKQHVESNKFSEELYSG